MSFMIGRRPLALVAIARGVSWFGDQVAVIALLLRLQPAGVATVTALLVCGLAPAVLLPGLVGRVVDGYDLRVVLAVSGVAQAALCVVLAFTGSTVAVLALVAALGAGQALNGAAWSTSIALVAPPGDRAIGVAWMQAATTLAGIVAPGAGGILTGIAGTSVPLLVDAASFVGVLVIGVIVPATTRHGRVHRGREHGGLAIVRRDPVLRLLFTVVGGFVLVGSAVNVVDVFLVRDVLRASSTWYGLCGSAYAAGALAGTLLASRWSATVELARAFVVAAAVLGAGLAVMGLAPAVGWLVPAGLVAGAGQGTMNVAIKTLVVTLARDGEVGRVAALLGAVVAATQLVALGAGGALAGVLGPRTIFVLGGAAAVLVPLSFGRRMVRASQDRSSADLSSMTRPHTASA